MVLGSPFRDSNWPPNTGASHRQSAIFAAVSPAPQRPLFASGRLSNGHALASSPRNRFINSSHSFGVKPFPPLQFCWLRLLPDLLYIPKWRGSKETVVFAGELGAADIANVIRRSRRIHRLDQHEPSSLLQGPGLADG